MSSLARAHTRGRHRIRLPGTQRWLLTVVASLPFLDCLCLCVLGREPSAIPSAVRNLLPNTQALLGDSEAHRFVLTLATAVMANAVAFTYLAPARTRARTGRPGAQLPSS